MQCNEINCRFLHAQSDVPYFKTGPKPEGKFCDTSAIMFPATTEVLKPLLELITAQHREDGVTTTGQDVIVPVTNTDGTKCSRCQIVGEDLYICTVS